MKQEKSNNAKASSSFPLEIKLSKNKRTLKVKFDDGKSCVLGAELLRIESPSAEVQGHGGPKLIVRNKVDIEINNIELVGNYAIRITFSDKHNSGLYTWDYLTHLFSNEKKLMQEYYKKLKS
tara:strand:- start:401 stop:766 length:366 start_codon:yes stop_codon:yes gene_type:complete